jgi:catechol 2,3-dioxygenase-like lactoylglutathione lyase family enzyme
MRLNHLDLPVPDVAEARRFFEQWFGFTHERTLGQDGLSILRDESGLVLVLSRRSRRGPQDFPETFHIGFHLETVNAVQTLYQRLAAAGIASAPPTEQRGAFSFYLTAPGGVLVEIAHRPE